MVPLPVGGLGVYGCLFVRLIPLIEVGIAAIAGSLVYADARTRRGGSLADRDGTNDVF